MEKLQLCAGDDCPRRHECQRYVEHAVFGKTPPFLSVLCERIDDKTLLDEFVPLEKVEISAPKKPEPVAIL